MNVKVKRPRFSIDLPEDYQVFLAQQAKLYKITQGEVVELLLQNMHCCVGIEDALRARREMKVATRQAASIKAAFERMTPEQQREALHALDVLRDKVPEL